MNDQRRRSTQVPDTSLEAPANPTPSIVVVDMDGTLLVSDSLWETVLQILHDRPWKLIPIIGWLFLGKAGFKDRISTLCPDPVLPPLDPEVIRYLRSAKDQGRTLVLATASDVRIARKVASDTQLFDRVWATEKGVNLQGEAKLRRFREEFGDQPFEYLGNSADDLPLWEAASRALLIRTPDRIRKRLEEVRSPQQIHVLAPPAPQGVLILKVLRLHQWAKGCLVFLPMFLSHRLLEPQVWGLGLLAFLAIGFAASAQYLWNDLLDLQADRNHPNKRNRPLASGAFPVQHAVPWMIGFLLLALGFGAMLGRECFGLILGYLILSGCYSLHLKSMLGMDIILLTVFHTGRILLGGAATEIPISSWAILFSIFLFTAVGLSKRIAEKAHPSQVLAPKNRRGYLLWDLEMMGAHAAASGMIAAFIVGLYAASREAALLYHNPEWLWLTCLIQIYWTFRLLVLSRRGFLAEDPTVFAIKDRATWCCLVAIFIIAWLAK